MAKAAHGLADDLLTNTLLTARCPVVFAPAMHTEMWEHPATQANVATLRSRGALVIEPAEGRLTGADTGKGRLPDPAEIFALATDVLARGGQHGGGLAGPGRPARGGLGGRHPGVPRPGALHRQPVLGPSGLRPGPHRGRPRRRGDPGRRQRRRCPTPPGSRSCTSRPPPSCGTPSSTAAAAADAVVMAAAPADFRPDRGQRGQDQEGRRRQRPGDRAHPEPRHPGRLSPRPTHDRHRRRRSSPPRPATRPAP